jgi:hypothetical protein
VFSATRQPAAGDQTEEVEPAGEPGPGVASCGQAGALGMNTAVQVGAYLVDTPEVALS